MQIGPMIGTWRGEVCMMMLSIPCRDGLFDCVGCIQLRPNTGFANDGGTYLYSVVVHTHSMRFRLVVVCLV